MANQEQEQTQPVVPTLEEKYQAQSSDAFVDQEGNYQGTVDVVGDALKNKQSTADILTSMAHSEQPIFNDVNYYVDKYSKEKNPLDTDAIPASQIVKTYNQAKIQNAKKVSLNKRGVDLAALKFQNDVQSPEVSGRSMSDKYLGNVKDLTPSYAPYHDIFRNEDNERGTGEERASAAPYILKNGKRIPNPGKDGMDKMFGDGKAVVTTTIDPTNGREVFDVLPSDAFVAGDRQYSTKWGPKETFGSSIKDFFVGAYSAATAGTMSSFSSVGALFNNAMNHDETYLYKQGNEAIQKHYDKVRAANLAQGNTKAVEELDKAFESGDYTAMNQAFNYSYSSLPSNVGNSLRREAQPLNWAKGDKALQDYFNEWKQAEFKQSASTEQGTGAIDWMVRQAPTLGYLLPQIAVGMASGGAMSALEGTAAFAGKSVATKALQYGTEFLVNAIGTSQSYSSFQRVADENGVSPETTAKFGFFALPLTYVTEHFTNKWIGEQLGPNIAEKAMREIYAPMAQKLAAKEAAGTLTDKTIKEAVYDSFSKIYNSKFIKGIVDNESYLANVAKANVSEVFQENFEQALYNTVQMQVDKTAPAYSEVGNGQIGTTGVFEGFSDTSLGTIFATTLMTAITGAVPHVIKKIKGIPDSKTEVQQKELLKWKVLKGQGDELINIATDHIQKPDGGMWGVKDILIKDATIGEQFDPNLFVVPKSPSLQKLGYQEGQLIDNFAEMRYVEFVQLVDSYKELNESMGLNDVDRNILSQAGFDSQISLNKSGQAFIDMRDSKAAIESFQPKEAGATATDEQIAQLQKENEEAKQPLVDKYNKALAEYEYYTKREEGTQNSKAANDLMKRNITVMKQVEMEMQGLTNSKEFTREMKNDPNFQRQYTASWENVIKKNFTYENIENLRQRVDEAAQAQQSTASGIISDIDNQTTYSTLSSDLDTLQQRIGNTLTKSYDEAEHKSLITDIAGLSNRLAKELSVFNDQTGKVFGSVMDNTKLDEIKNKWGQLYDSSKGLTSNIAQQAEGKILTPANEKVDTYTKRVAELEPFITTKQSEYDSQLEVINSLPVEATNEQRQEQTDKLTSIQNELNHYQQESQLAAEEVGKAERTIESFDDEQFSHDNQLNAVARALGLENVNNQYSSFSGKGKLPFMRIDGQTLEHANETPEEFNKRIELMREQNTPNGKTFLSNYFTELQDTMKEAETWIDSVLTDQGETYKKEYPDGKFYGTNGSEIIRQEITRIKENEHFLYTFKTSERIANEKKVNDHQSLQEKEFVSELASKNANGDNEYELQLRDALRMADELASKIDGADLANQMLRLHSRVIIHENTFKSVQLFTTLGLRRSDGTQIISQNLIEELNAIGELDPSILDTKGQLTESQLTQLSKRENIVNNILSEMNVEYNKENSELFSKDNQDLLFEIFREFYVTNDSIGEDGKVLNSEGTLLHADDSASHIGENGSLTNSTRELHARNPLFTMQSIGGVTKRKYNFSSSNANDITRLREHLNTLIWIGSKYSMNDMFKIRKMIFTNESNTPLETGEQEAAINSIVGLLSNKTLTSPLSLFANYFLPMHSIATEKGGHHFIESYLSNALTIGGDYGTGKTQFTVGRAFRILRGLDGYSTDKKSSVGKLTVVSITEELSKVHKQSFGAENPTVISYTDFIKGMKSMNTTEGNTYVIDEASLVSENEMKAIKEHFVNTKAKLVFMGDVFQMRDAGSVGHYPLMMLQTMTTHMLTEQFSATSPLLRQLAEACRPAIGAIGRIVKFDKVTEDISGKTKLGARFFASHMDVWNSFIDGLATNPDRAAIFLDQDALDAFTKDNDTLKKQIEANKDKIYFALRRGVNDNKLLQGLRQKEIYAVFRQSDSSQIAKPITTSLMASALYTAIGRSSSWYGMVGDTSLNVDRSLAASTGLPEEALNAIQLQQKEKFRAIETLRLQGLNTDMNSMSMEAQKVATAPIANPTVTTPNPSNNNQNQTSGKEVGLKINYFNADGDLIDTATVDADWEIKKVGNRDVLSINWNGQTKFNNTIDPNISIKDNLIKHITGFESILRTSQSTENPITLVEENSVEDYEHKGTALKVGESYYDNNEKDIFQLLSINESVFSDGSTQYEITGIYPDENQTVSTVLSDNEDFSVPTAIIEEVKPVVPNEVSQLSRERFLNNSTAIFDKNKNKSHIFWATSATLVGASDSLSQENGKLRRAINDAFISNLSQYKHLFQLKAEKQNTTGWDKDNKTAKYDMIVLSFDPTNKGLVGEQLQAIQDIFMGTIAEDYVNAIIKKHSVNPNGTSIKAMDIPVYSIINDIFTTPGLNGGKFSNAIGSMTLPSVISIDGSGKISYTSFDVKETELEKQKTEKQRLVDAWNAVINNPIFAPVQSELIKQRDMNMSIYDTHASITDKVNVDFHDMGIRKVEYSNNESDLTTVTDLLKDFPGAQTDITPLYIDGRLRLNVQLNSNESIRLVVQMPKFSQSITSKNETIKQRANASMDSIIGRIKAEEDFISQEILSSTILSDEQKWKAKQTAFSKTTIYKLLRANLSTLKNSTQATDKAIFAFIKIQQKSKTFLDINLDSFKTDKDRNSGFDSQYKELSDFLSKKDNLAMSGLYDFLTLNNETYTTHVSGKETIDMLNVQALGINNKSFYVGLDKVEPITSPTPPVNKPGKKKLPNIGLEETQYSSPDVEPIQQSIDRVALRLGQSYTESELFLTQEGKIRLNGLTASGMVQDNTIMTLAAENGMMPRSTVDHEVLHVVYRNFINTDAKAMLLQAAQVINKYEQGTPINGDKELEEWIARDYAKQERATTKDKNVNIALRLYNQFKSFLKDIVMGLRGVYGSNKQLKNLYNQINNGEFANRVPEMNTEKSDIAFEEYESDTTSEETVQSTNESSSKRLLIASQMEEALKKELYNTESLVIAKSGLRMSILQNSIFSNTKNSNINSLSESINSIIEEGKEYQELYGETMATVITQNEQGELEENEMAVKDIVENGEPLNIKLSDINGRNSIDAYKIYSDKNIRMIVQTMLPSYDMMNDSFEKEVGAGERFDWDGYSSEQNVSDIQKLYLSSIPLINTNGSAVFDARGKVKFLDQKQVHSLMIDLGMRVSQMDGVTDKVSALKSIMEGFIDNSEIDESNRYLNPAAEVIHSMYNYMFEAKGKGTDFSLDYSNHYISEENYDGRYKGLLERSYQNEQEWKQEVGAQNSDATWSWDAKQEDQKRKIEQAKDLLNSLVSVYTSFNVKDQVKFTYYDDTMKSTHYYKDFWRGTAEEIKRIQGYKILNGELNTNSISFFKENMSIDYTDIKVSRYNNVTNKTSFLKYENGRFKFANKEGVIATSKKFGNTTMSPFSTDMLNTKGEYAHIVDIFNRIKGQFALKGVTPAMFKSLMVANSWSEVTDNMKTINKIGYVSNFNSEIQANYATPSDFMADYLGAMITLYNQYSKNYTEETLKANEDINKPAKKVIIQRNLLNHIRYNTKESLSPLTRIQSITGSDIVLGFLNRTTPKNLITFEVQPDIVENEEITNDVSSMRYVTPEDMFVSSNMIASIQQKLGGQTNDTHRYTAKGTATYSVALKTTLNEEFDAFKQDPTDTTKITGFIESIGENRSLGFTSIGKTKIDTSDFIDTSINMFMQEMVKSKARPVIYVPTTTVSDTGKIIFAKVESTLINTDNGFNIDYSVAGTEVLREYDKIKKRINTSRSNLNNALMEINKSLSTKTKFLNAPAENNEAHFTKGLRKQMIDVSKEAQANGTFDQLRNMFDATSLTKDLSGKGSYELSYETVDGIDVIIPGNAVTGKIDQFNMINKQSKIEKIRSLTNDVKSGKVESLPKLERAIMRLFENDFAKFTDMIANYGFKPVQSMNNLTKNTIGDKNPTNTTDKNPYYQQLEKSEIRFNQPMFGFYMATMFANNHIDDFSLNPFSFKNYLDKVKRNGPIHTPAQSVLTQGTKEVVQNNVRYQLHTPTLTTESPIVFYRDNMVDGGNTYQEIDGQKVLANNGNMMKPEDGQITINPFHYLQTLNSIGGTKTVIGNASMYKGLTNFRRADGTYSQIKRGDKVITGFDMQHTYYRNMFMRMLAETDRQLVARVGEESFNENKLSFTDKFKELYDDKNNQKEFNDIIVDMMNWIDNQQYYQDRITINPDGIERAGHMYNSIVAFMAPVSTQKGSVTSVNTYDALNDVDYSQPLNMDVVDNTKTKIVMNPSQDTDINAKLQAAPSQQDATGLGVSNNPEISSLYSAYMENKQGLQTALRKELEESISKYGEVEAAKQFKNIDWSKYDVSTLTEQQKSEIDPAIKQLMDFMRDRVVNSLRTSGQDMAFIELFSDMDVSMQLPMMRSKVLQSYRNMANQSIQARTKGIRLTQTVGEYLEEFVRDGKIYSRNDAINELRPGTNYRDYSFDEYNSDAMNQELAAAGFTMQRLQDMNIVNGKTTVGHISMPNVYAKVYGHRSNESLIDIQHINLGTERIALDSSNLYDKLMAGLSEDADMSLNQWSAFVDSPMIRKAIKNLKIETYVDELINPSVDNDGKRFISKRIANLIDSTREMTTEELQSEVNATNESILEAINSMELQSTDLANPDKVIAALMGSGEILEQILTEAQQLLKDFEESNTSFLSRVPATFLGSGGVFKTAMFHNGGNVVYIPTGMTLRNDSDYDIDALTMYSNSLDSKGHIIQKGADGHRNKMNALRNTITLHSGNQESLFLTSSLDKINEVMKQKEKLVDNLQNNSIRSIYESYSRNKAGADAIGILANSLTVSSIIISSSVNKFVETGTHSGIQNFINENAPKGKIKTGLNGFVIELGTWGQGALDNAKNNTFANYAISPVGINILAVLKLNGMNNSEVYDFFNNKNIRNLFHTYSGKTSIMTKSADFNLWKMASTEVDKIASRIEHFNNTNVSQWLESKGLSWKSNVHDTEKYSLELETTDVLLQQSIDDLLMKELTSYYKNNKEAFKNSPYDFTGSDKEQLLQQWKKDNGFDDENLFTYKNNKIVFDKTDVSNFDIKDLDSISTEVANELKLMVRSRANINIARTDIQGLRYMKMVPKLSVTADALYRLSTIMGMRNGIPSLDKDFRTMINTVQQTIGMSLQEYNSNPASDMNVAKHMAYYTINNDAYNKEQDEKKKAFMFSQEQLVANEINMGKLIKNLPQIDYILQELYRQELITKQSFMADNEAIEKDVVKSFLKLQNRTTLNFGGEVAAVSTAINDIMLDKYYATIGESAIMKGQYIYQAVGNTYENPSQNLDLSSLFDRQSFVKNFPQFMMDIVEHSDNIDYLNKTVQSELPAEEWIRFAVNPLIKLFTIGGKFDVKLLLDVNTKEMTEQRVAQLKDYFNSLPKEYKEMLINYEIIANRMSYRQGGLLQVIGVDFYKGPISKVYNDTYAELRSSLGLDSLVPNKYRKSVTFNSDIRERIYDYLGLQPEFAQYLSPKAVVNENSPKYAYQFETKTIDGEKVNTGHRINLKLNDNNAYEVFGNITSLGMSTMAGENMTSELRSFQTTPEEEYNLSLANRDNNDLILHQGSRAWVSEGQFLYTRSGKLIRVIKVKGTNFEYRLANDSDITYRMEQKEMDTQKRNNRIQLKEGTLQHSIFDPNATSLTENEVTKPMEYKVKGNMFLSQLNINTLTNDGVETRISIFDNKNKFNSINEVLDAYKYKVLSTIGEKTKNFPWDLKNYQNEEHRRNKINKYIRNLVDDVQVVETEKNANEIKQIKIAMAQLNFKQSLIVKALVQARALAYISSQGKNMVEQLTSKISSTDFLANQKTTFNKEVEDMSVGITTYGKVARSAIVEMINPAVRAEMKATESKRSEMLNTLEGSLELFDSEIAKKDSKKEVAEGEPAIGTPAQDNESDNNDEKNKCK
jgi:hypothetical protein